MYQLVNLLFAKICCTFIVKILTTMEKTLKELREESSLTLRETAEMIGVTAKTLSRIENNLTIPNAETKYQIELLYGKVVNFPKAVKMIVEPKMRRTKHYGKALQTN